MVVGVVEEEVEMEDLSDDSSSDSDAHFYSDLSDEDAIDGEPGAYYGGYGHCYRCGKGFHFYLSCVQTIKYGVWTMSYISTNSRPEEF